MNQSEQASISKVPSPAVNITRFFLLLIALLLVTIGVMVQSSINSWLKDKSEQIVSIADAINKRVETYRYATWQLYNNVTVTPIPADELLQETRLRQDVYYLEKPRLKTEALIFGSHDSGTLGMAQQTSAYLDTLWGAEDSPWSMYYLNGLDNSMILVSTLPLTDFSSGFRDVGVASIVDSRRAEMLQQANTLDERESFSMLRRLNWQNLYYFTLRTTFNMPGHLPTVVAFDLPINNLIPAQMAVDNFRLESSQQTRKSEAVDKDDGPRVNIGFNHARIEVTAPIVSTPLRLVWQVPYSLLILEALKNIFFPLLLNLGLIVLAFFGLNTFRNQPKKVPETSALQDELHTLRILNEEIVTLMPLGILAYDLDARRTVISNPIADRLLPHLNLHKIMTMADQRQGVIQTTVNNELYEIQQFRSQVAPQIQIFVIRDQDREILVNKKMRQAQQLYEQNQQARRAFMKHIGDTLQQPAQDMMALTTTLPEEMRQNFVNVALTLVQRIDEIRLINSLDDESWESQNNEFSLAALLDDVVVMMLPALKRKGLQLLVNNRQSVNTYYYGNAQILRSMLILLLQYAITVTQIGRITLNVGEDADHEGQLRFSLLDTGASLSQGEVENIEFPFLNETSSDRQGKANGLTFYLCERLANKLGGSMSIKNTPEIGTRYDLRLPLPVVPGNEPQGERLLDDVVAMLDITSSDIRKIVARWLENQGATCRIADERQSGHHYDVFLTDNPSALTASGLLLSDDEPGVRQMGVGQFCVNFNINRAMQDGILQLIETQLSLEQDTGQATLDDAIVQLSKSGYYALFVETVPEDIKRLYAQYSAQNITALSQTAHRLKGVFAMLNLIEGKQLCEHLERQIQDNSQDIQKNINDIDTYVKCLLQQGSLLHE